MIEEMNVTYINNDSNNSFINTTDNSTILEIYALGQPLATI